MTVELEEQLFNLINNGSLQEIKDFYNNNPSVAVDEKPFSWACAEGHLEVAKWLLEVNPNININISNGNEYIFRSVCSHGHLHVAKWLLEIKPDIVISAENNVAFFSACRYKNNDVALWLTTLDQRYIVVIQNDVILDYYVV